MLARADTLTRNLFDIAQFDPLWRGTESVITGRLQGIPFRANICIPEYGAHIGRYYRSITAGSLAAMCGQSDISFIHDQFGLRIAFEEPVDIAIHEDDMVLENSVRALVARFGPVLFRNANIAGTARDRCHHTISPNLRFHTDRGPDMANRYSCFTRDSNDAEQREPRQSSTLFIANIVSWLQGVREGQCDPAIERGARMSLDLFMETQMASVLGDVILEQRWDAPIGTGEIAVIDNADILHATYHRNGSGVKGYRIGARYLN